MQSLFNGLSFIQILQLAMGLFCLGDFFFYSGQGVVLVLGIVLLAQAVFNKQLGCASGACARRPETTLRKRDTP